MTLRRRPEIPMFKHLPAAMLALAHGIAAAHEGHGFAGAHGHASDLFGPALLLGAAVTALWFWRRK